MKVPVVFVLGSVLSLAVGDDSTESVTKRWLEIQANLEETLAEQSKNVLRLIAPILEDVDIDPACFGTFKRLQNGLRELDVPYMRSKW